MTTVAIRKKLTAYMQVADEKKIKAMYALLESDIEQEEIEYPKEFKASLDKRYEYYQKGGKMISASLGNKKIAAMLNPDIQK